jgi:hypothetical protein
MLDKSHLFQDARLGWRMEEPGEQVGVRSPLGLLSESLKEK